jgi:spore coat protein CotH
MMVLLIRRVIGMFGIRCANDHRFVIFACDIESSFDFFGEDEEEQKGGHQTHDADADEED